MATKVPSSAASSPKPRSARPAHHANDSATAFKNPWPSADAPTWTELAQQPFPIGWAMPALHTHAKAREVRVVQPDWGQVQLEVLAAERGVERNQCVVGTWLGHAGTLVAMPLEGQSEERLWMLFDPIFSARAGPTQWTGPRRLRDSPCQVADLPGCDVVFISHNHYDHLDLTSILTLLKRFPTARYFVPLGNKSWFIETGVPEEFVFELDWWDERTFRPEDFGYQPPQREVAETQVRFTCVPAQHTSGRAGMDWGSTLWCGWVVEQFVTSKVEGQSASRKGAIYHAGDTGYRRSARSDIVCPAFKEIGKRLGSFDLSFIPIWRGGTLGFVSSLGLRLSHRDMPSTLHGSPADAVAIHRDVKSRNTVGIHFGTFVGAENESYEAVIEFAEACEEHGVRSLDDDVEGESGRAGTLDIGASLVVEIA